MLTSTADLDERALAYADRATDAIEKCRTDGSGIVGFDLDLELARLYVQLASAARLSHMAVDLAGIKGSLSQLSQLALAANGRPAPARRAATPASDFDEIVDMLAARDQRLVDDGVNSGLIYAESIVRETLASNPAGPLGTAIVEALRAHRIRIPSR